MMEPTPETPSSLEETHESLAILIDGENISYLLVGRMLAEAERWGTVTVRQVYLKRPFEKGEKGWSERPPDAWYDAAVCYDFEVRTDVPAQAGKNAVDIALTVGAMDLFHAGIRQFCLATSDHDFVALVSRLRHASCLILGIGTASTSSVLRGTYTRFVGTDNLPAPVPWTRLWEVVKYPASSKGWNDGAMIVGKRRTDGTAQELALTDVDIAFLQSERPAF